MAEGILVTYATHRDSTRGIASAIADVLRDGDFIVALEPVGAITSLTGCRAVVLGSAVYDGEWLPEVGEFLEDHASALARVPVWIYASGPVDPIPTGAEADVPAELLRAIDEIKPRDVVLFVGALQPHHVGAGLRVLSRLARIPAADHRDWLAIERWACGIRDALVTDLGSTRAAADPPPSLVPA